MRRGARLTSANGTLPYLRFSRSTVNALVGLRKCEMSGLLEFVCGEGMEILKARTDAEKSNKERPKGRRGCISKDRKFHYSRETNLKMTALWVLNELCCAKIRAYCSLVALTHLS